MQIDCDRSRQESLSVALSTKDDLQRAISAGKHGMHNKHSKNSPIRVRDLLHARTKGTKTVAVHHSMAESQAAYIWYAKSTVYIKDIYLELFMNVDETVDISFSNDKMALHVLDRETLLRLMMNVGRMLGQYVDARNVIHVLLSDVPNDIMNTVVRTTPFSTCSGDWKMVASGGDVYTIFRGDKYFETLRFADVVFSINVELNISYMGKANSAMIYRKYVADPNIDFYVGKMLCSKPLLKGDDYGSIGSDNPVKMLTINDLINTVSSTSIGNAVDELDSIESALIAGVTLRDE